MWRQHSSKIALAVIQLALAISFFLASVLPLWAPIR
jgi:hypothetical protein